jgi:hypothetical protein
MQKNTKKRNKENVYVNVVASEVKKRKEKINL